jgi:hypothetical protein
MKIIETCEQGSAEWLEMRLGKVRIIKRAWRFTKSKSKVLHDGVNSGDTDREVKTVL